MLRYEMSVLYEIENDGSEDFEFPCITKRFARYESAETTYRNLCENRKVILGYIYDFFTGAFIVKDSEEEEPLPIVEVDDYGWTVEVEEA